MTFGLDALHAPGDVTLRALATRVINFTSNSGIPGTIPTQLAGQNTGGSGTLGNTPHWKVYAIQSWHFHNMAGAFYVDVGGRFALT